MTEDGAKRAGAALRDVSARAPSAQATVLPEDRRWVENRPSTGWFPRLDVRELWASRELVLFFALRNVKLRYKQTVLGAAWAVIQPLVGVAIFTVVFGRLAGIPSEGIPYPVFVFAGLSIWQYFSSATGVAAESLVQSRDLVTKVYFPRLLAPLAAVLPSLVDLGISLLALGVFLAIFAVAPGTAVVLVPVWVLAAMMFAFGVGTWLAALNVKYRDVRNVLTFLMQVWLYATPVVFPSSLVEGGWRWLFYLNPMAGIVDGFRWSLADTGAPGPEALMSLVVGLLVLLSGVFYFRRVERRFADFI